MIWVWRGLIALLATYPVYFSFNLIIHEIVTDDLATCGSVPLSMGLILSGSALIQTACLALWRATYAASARFQAHWIATPFALPLIYLVWLSLFAPQCIITVAR